MNIIVYPNCKINIGLHITEKREDSYHNLETLFFPILEKTDILEIVSSDKLSVHYYGIECNWPIETELCVKAYNLVAKDYDIPPVEIHLYKNNPPGSGLGGGSSDAAHTIKALNKLFSLEISTDQMVEYARQLGSDVPFFIYNTPMFGSGKGDILSQIDSPSIDKLWGERSEYTIEIVTPDIKIDTPQAYKMITPRNLKGVGHRAEESLRELLLQPLDEWKEIIVNDFEEAIFKMYPEIEVIKRELYERGAIYASMSGSGSSLFGIFKK